MEWYDPTDEQRAVHKLKDSPSRYVLIIGSTGAGKTLSAVHGFMAYAIGFPRGRFGIAGKTTFQTMEVVMPIIIDLCLWRGYALNKRGAKAYRISKGGAWIDLLFMDGANISAKARIQGLDLTGLYIDEVVNINSRVFAELENRVRADERSKIVMTANPEQAAHWLKRDYVDRASDIGMDIHHLDWMANPALPDSFKESMRATSDEAQARNRIDGEWGPSTTAIYHFKQVGVAPPRSACMRWSLAVDPADAGATHALLMGDYDEGGQTVTWVVDEWRHDGRRQDKLAPHVQAERIAEWLKAIDIQLEYIVYDYAGVDDFSATLARLCRARRVVGKKAVLPGINKTRTWLARGRIKVDRKCRYLRSELDSYQWDERAYYELGERKPRKVNDHAVDCLRYWVMTPPASTRLDRAVFPLQNERPRAPEFAHG